MMQICDPRFIEGSDDDTLKKKLEDEVKRLEQNFNEKYVYVSQKETKVDPYRIRKFFYSQMKQ